MKPTRILIVLWATLLAGCAQLGGSTSPADDVPGDPDYHVLMAEIAMQRRQVDVAAGQYYRALMASDDAELAARAGQVVYDYGTYDEALATARRWAELDPEALEPRRQLVLLRLQAGEHHRALEHLEFFYERLDEAGERRLEALMPLLIEARDRQAALEAAKAMAKRHPEDPSGDYAVAYAALQAGDVDLALARSARALEAEPGNDDAAMLHARALLALDRIEEAFAMLSAREGFRTDVRLRLEFAVLKLVADRPEEARLELQLILGEHDRLPGALRTLAYLEFEQGNDELAERYFIELLSTGRFVSDALFYLGALEEDGGSLDEAVEFYSRVTSGDNAAPAQIRMAMILYRLGRAEEAVDGLAGFALANPGQAPELAPARGELLARLGRPDEALKIYERLLQRYPGDEDLLYARAFMLERMDRVDEALEQMRALLKRNPDDPTALNALGYTLADRTDDYREAHRLIERAYELAPDNPAIIDSMGWVSFRMGRLEAALEHLRRAWSLDHDPEIAAHLAEVLWTSGRRDEAREILYQALADNPDSVVLQKALERLQP